MSQAPKLTTWHICPSTTSNKKSKHHPVQWGFQLFSTGKTRVSTPGGIFSTKELPDPNEQEWWTEFWQTMEIILISHKNLTNICLNFCVFCCSKRSTKNNNNQQTHGENPVAQYHLKYSTSKKSKSEAIAPPDRLRKMVP